MGKAGASREEGETRNANFAARVAAAPLPRDRQGACRPRSWARDHRPPLLLYGPVVRPVARGGGGYHGDGAWVATVTREPVEVKAAADSWRLGGGGGVQEAERPRPLRTGWARSVSQGWGRHGGALVPRGAAPRSPFPAPRWRAGPGRPQGDRSWREARRPGSCRPPLNPRIQVAWPSLAVARGSALSPGLEIIAIIFQVGELSVREVCF